MAELLKDAGYDNGYVGKVHYGSPNGPGERNFPTQHGFDEFFGSENARIHYLIHNQKAIDDFDAARAKNPAPSNSWGMGPFRDGTEEVDLEGMSTEIFGEKARDFISRKKDEPFFLYLSFNAVHNFTHQLPEAYLKEHGLEDYGDWDPAKEPYLDWYYRTRRPNNPEGRRALPRPTPLPRPGSRPTRESRRRAGHPGKYLDHLRGRQRRLSSHLCREHALCEVVSLRSMKVEHGYH